MICEMIQSMDQQIKLKVSCIILTAFLGFQTWSSPQDLHGHCLPNNFIEFKVRSKNPKYPIEYNQE